MSTKNILIAGAIVLGILWYLKDKKKKEEDAAAAQQPAYPGAPVPGEAGEGTGQAADIIRAAGETASSILDSLLPF